MHKGCRNVKPYLTRDKTSGIRGGISPFYYLWTMYKGSCISSRCPKTILLFVKFRHKNIIEVHLSFINHSPLVLVSSYLITLFGYKAPAATSCSLAYYSGIVIYEQVYFSISSQLVQIPQVTGCSFDIWTFTRRND